MNTKEYNEIVDALYNGHEIEFQYNNASYYLERCENVHELYKIINDDEGILIQTIEGPDLKTRIDLFLDMPFFDNMSFNQIVSTLEYVEID